VVFDPRADTFLPREGSGNRGRHLNHSDAAAVATYKRATDKPVQDGAQEQDLGAHVIIIRVPRQDGSEASSGSARHTPIDPYSVAYVCTLDLSLEL